MEGCRRPVAILMAAGLGTRMKSDLAKVLHPLAGEPLVVHGVRALREAGVDTVVVVVGHQAERVKQVLLEAFGPGTSWLRFAGQEQQLGTGHAVAQAIPRLEGFEGPCLVTSGDAPLITVRTLQRLLDQHLKGGFAATLLSTIVDDPTGYGRVIRPDASPARGAPDEDEAGPVERVVEEKDATPEERRVREINAGFYCFELGLLRSALDRIEPANAQAEYYLPDTLSVLRQDGHPIAAVVTPDPDEVMGINDRAQLAQAEAAMQRRLQRRLMLGGVTILAPETVHLEAAVEVGRDSVLYPNTWLQGRTRIGAGSHIGPGAHLMDTEVGDGCAVWGLALKGAWVDSGAMAGPGAFLSGESIRVGAGARVGTPHPFASPPAGRVPPGRPGIHGEGDGRR